MTRMRITETVEIDLDKEMWCCSRCHAEIHPARESYLKGCLVYERPADEIYGPPIPIKQDSAAISYAPEPDFMRIVEFTWVILDTELIRIFIEVCFNSKTRSSVCPSKDCHGDSHTDC